jgi:hypothetical protein
MAGQTSNTPEKNKGAVERKPWHPATEPSENLNPMHPAPNFTKEDVEAFLGPENPEAQKRYDEEGKRILEERRKNAERTGQVRY